MNGHDIQIVELEPMRAASVYAFGNSPELEAWKKLVSWAEPKGFLNDKHEHPIFGFNNPNPVSENSKYGYELWIKVSSEIEPYGELRIIEFRGGPYAVIRCEALGQPYKNIPAGWQHLVDWCKMNDYKLGYHQSMEKFIANGDDPENLILDLFCPIQE